MATFSWSDNLKIAFRSCSPCLWPLKHNPADDDDDDDELLRQNNRPINRHSRSRSDELHGLLANASHSTDTTSDTDIDAERMSLHSNPGCGGSSKRKKNLKQDTWTRRRSRKTVRSSLPWSLPSDINDDIDNDNDNPRRRITLFGYNLFGRRPPPPPIHLADDTEDALYSRRGGGPTTPNTLSHSTRSSTFDSDAAPLDTDTIAALSSPTTAAAVIKAAAQSSAELEAQRLKEKEERRRRRKEKKELKRMAELLVRQGIVGDGDEFEGFQGSGSGIPAVVGQSTYPRIPAGMLSASDSGSVQREKSTPGAVSAPPREEGNDDDDDDDDKADLDGSHYARNASGISNRGSDDSRSRTSTSFSDRMHPLSERTPPAAAEPRQKISLSKDKPQRSSSSRTTKSSSSSNTSRQMVSPSTVEQGQGFFDLEDVDVSSSSLPPAIHRPDPGYLPITGFGGGTPGSSRIASNLGARILAQRGVNDANGD